MRERWIMCKMDVSMVIYKKQNIEQEDNLKFSNVY